MYKLSKSRILVLFLTIVFLFSILGCEKDPTEPEENEAPALPPVESMQMDLSFFTNPPGQALAKTTLSKQNFIAAAGRVVIINAVVILASVVPTAFFIAALSQPPELQSDGKFHWIYAYTTPNGVHTYSVDLAGWIDVPNAEALWEVYVTSASHSPTLNHFLWYEGRSKIGNKEGWWMFHDDQLPDTLVDVLKIDWQVPDSTHQELIFSNVWDTHEDYGDSLKYSVDNNNDYLIFYDASKSQTNTIFWDSQTGAGFIEWFDYKEWVKSCWDNDQNDIECPPM